MLVKRGEIYYADLSPVVGSEQGGIRPVLIVQNDTGTAPPSSPLPSPAAGIRRSCPHTLTCRQPPAD